MYHITSLHDQMHLDASLQELRDINYVYALAIPLCFIQYNIAQLNMVNVDIAFKIWGHLWANKLVEICCENRAVVEILSFGNARDAVLAACARNEWLSAMYNITVDVSHVKGNNNTVADLLSQWRGSWEDIAKLH